MLSDKAQAGKIKIIGNISLAQAKTKEMVKVLEALGVKKSALIILSVNDATIERASKNIKGIKVVLGRALKVYDMLKHDEMIIMKDAVPVLEEAYA